MSEEFDPYYKWLGIPRRDQPPNHYRLLGIELFEQDRDVIDAAANRLMGYLKELAVGDEAAHSQRLLNEIARARICLLNPAQKGRYDQDLRNQLAARKPAARRPPPAEERGWSGPPSPASQPSPLPPPVARPLEEIWTASGEVESPAAMPFAGPTGAPPPYPAAAVPRDSRPEGPDFSSFPGIPSPRTAPAEGEPFRIVVNSDAKRKEIPTPSAPELEDGDPEQPKPKWSRRMIAVAAAAALAAALAVGATIYRSMTSSEDSGPSPTLVDLPPPQLLLQLTPEERRQVSELQIDGVAQVLPPQGHYELHEGQHRIRMSRDGFQPIADTITLVRGQQKRYTPRWRRADAP